VELRFDNTIYDKIDSEAMDQAMNITASLAWDRDYKLVEELADPEGDEYEKIAFDWSFLNVTGRSLFIQLHFIKPNEVSPFMYEDEISIVIFNKTYFKSWDQERTLEHEITVLNSTLLKQMEVTNFT